MPELRRAAAGDANLQVVMLQRTADRKFLRLDIDAPEDLAGKKFIVIANLKPAVIRGVESNGMLLAAVVDDKASISFFDPAVPAGAKVK